jgi:hypothetical protein
MLDTKVAKCDAIDRTEFKIVELGKVRLASFFRLSCVVIFVYCLIDRGVFDAMLAIRARNRLAIKFDSVAVMREGGRSISYL